MKIVIEGPNNVGKSTFIAKLKECKEFKDFEIEHVDSKCPNDYKFHETLLSMPQDMIFDRFYIGETIYPGLYDRASKMSIEHLVDICKKYVNDTIIFIVDADCGFIERAYKNKDEQIDWDFVYKEKRMFEERYEMLKNESINIYKIKNHFDTSYAHEFTKDDAIQVAIDFYNLIKVKEEVKN